jgi:hypothetical protein
MTSPEFEAKNVDEAADKGADRLIAYLKMLGCHSDKIDQYDLQDYLKDWLRGFATTAKNAWAKGEDDV